MARADDRSLRDLKTNAERTRAEFTETVTELRSRVSESVDDLRERVSPAAIKAEVGDYFRTRGEMLMDKARENPLQAAAIGAGLAYPLLGIARSIPAPVLMIGAGLFLLGSSSGQNLSRRVGAAAQDLSDEIVSRSKAVGRDVRAAQDAASSRIAATTVAASAAMAALSRQASTVAGSIADRGDQLRGKAVDVVGSAGQQADNFQQAMKASVNAAPAAARDSLFAAAGSAKEAAAGATDYATDVVGRMGDQTVDAANRTAAALKEVVQKNPLLVGGTGLFIGAVIASALPRSDLERGTIGPVSSEVKRRANEATSRGFDAAKEIASTLLDEAMHHAEHEGLTPTDLHEATEDFGHRVRRVAENATTTAFELAAHSNPDAT
jgi:hypothetical protein